MLRFFDMFGRSAALTALDQAMRLAGLHPLLIPEPVKLALLQLLRKHAPGIDREADLADAAHLLAYCVLDEADYQALHGSDRAQAIENRIDAALDQTATLDSRVILLALHAQVMSPAMAERFDIAEHQVDGG